MLDGGFFQYACLKYRDHHTTVKNALADQVDRFDETDVPQSIRNGSNVPLCRHYRRMTRHEAGQIRQRTGVSPNCVMLRNAPMAAIATQDPIPIDEAA